MASSNRHWTSMFKSKPCNTQHQWQHDRNTSSLLPNPSQKPPYASSGVGAEERTPEPKPRWNPKPEQIRILEAIFNSGMVNPPRDEIRKIRIQLQEYGQVGDANVFYWFQNRKSRSKHKQRQLQSRLANRPTTSASTATATKTNSAKTKYTTASAYVPAAASYSSSTSSDPSNSSGCSDKTLHSSTSKTSLSGGGGLSNSPTTSVNNKTYLPNTTTPHGNLPLDFFFHGQAPGYNSQPMADLSLSTLVEPNSNVKSGLWNQHMMSRQQEEELKTTAIYDDSHNASEVSKGKNHLNNTITIFETPVATIVAPPITATTTTTSATTQDTSNILTDPFNGLLQGIGGVGCSGYRVVVLINEVAFEVGAGHLNVREEFGMEAVLLHSSGLPVLVDEWGTTLQPLQHGASYYLLV